MNFKKRAWQYATTLVVVLIMLNPEIAQLALFIDAIGLEIFMLLIETQVIALFFALLSSKLMLMFPSTRRVMIFHLIRHHLETVASPAMIMHLLVLSAAIGLVYNAI